MRISVIIPALNEESLIGRTLNSLKDITDTEVIVADGGSADRTVEISKGVAKVIKSGAGRGMQMNAGAGEASGEILLFIHADTFLPEGWDKSIFRAMSDLRIVGGAFSLSIDSNRFSHKVIAFTANMRARLMLLPFGDQGIFVRRSVFEDIGGYKLIPVMEDVDLIQRLKKSGKMALLKDAVMTSARRWEKEGALYTTLRNWLLIILYFLGAPPDKLYRFYKIIR